MKKWIKNYQGIPDGVHDVDIIDDGVFSVKVSNLKFIVTSDNPKYLVKDLNKVWCCAECGSTDVEEKRWVNMNTDKIIHETDDDYWCNNCEDYTDIQTVEEYEKGRRMLDTLKNELDKNE